MRSRFLALRVRPANRDIPRADDGTLPECWLIAEWPTGKTEPTDYWLSNLPADTPITTLVRLAKIRWRIEHDYRELKTGLGLDHFEGRTWTGWHRHVTLVTAAHLFLTDPAPDQPKSRLGRPDPLRHPAEKPPTRSLAYLDRHLPSLPLSHAEPNKVLLGR